MQEAMEVGESPEGGPRQYRRAEVEGGGREEHSEGAAEVEAYTRGEEEGERGRKVSE